MEENKDTKINLIDIRSDTVTKPTENMKKAMVNAKVGDEVYGEDPTIAELQNYAAQLFGKEAALYVTSGTQGNQLAIVSHLDGKKGYEIIIGNRQHIGEDEGGAVGFISNAQMRMLPHKENWELDVQQVESTIRKQIFDWIPQTGLICLENTIKGKAVSLEYMKQIRSVADKYKIPVHLDGARIFNAAVALQVDVKEIAQYADSVQFCLSKGLCCPIGSLLVGTKDLIQKAKRYRKLIGGTMRQAGVIAAPGLVALKEQVQELATDHKMAQIIHQQLSSFKELTLMPYDNMSTNMIFFKFVNEKYNNEPYNKEFAQHMLKNNVKIADNWETNDYYFRFVTHYYIRSNQVTQIVKSVSDYLNYLNTNTNVSQ